MDKQTYIKILSDNLNTLKMCTVPNGSWCPTCQEIARSMNQYSSMFYDSQVKQKEKITKEKSRATWESKK